MGTERLHKTHEPSTTWTSDDCGCIHRHDGQRLRACAEHNPKIGTHVGSSRRVR
jgi:hypothetical protein